MKKWILFLGIVISLVKISEARVTPPSDFKGNPLNTLDWVGALPCNIDTSTGAAAVLCGSAVPSIVYGVIASSMAATNFLVFEDSATANTTSSTATIVFANGSNVNASGASTTLTIKFPVPLEFSNGISVHSSVAPAGISTWTILYRPRNNPAE